MSTILEGMPQYSTRLIGRDTEVSEVIDLIINQEQRLVTLVGESGIGKTRLSLNIIKQLEQEIDIHFISLAAVQQAELVIPTLAHSLGIHQQGKSLQEAISATLGNTRQMLVIDNVEQVVEASAELEFILSQTACTILVTSQIPLNIDSECIYNVPPLAIPEEDIFENLEEVAKYAAVALFLDRLHTVQPGFMLTAHNVGDIVEICRQSRGIPLVIELVAAHSDFLPPADLLFLLNQYLAMAPYLSLKTTNTPKGREVILRPVLDWCYSRLDSTLQELFRTMGAFLGGCTFDDLKAIYKDSVLEPRHLGALVQKNLILHDTHGNRERYEMLDAVREYATRRLQKDQEGHVIETEHAKHYAALAKTCSMHFNGPEQEFWINRLLYELPNLRKAMQWFLDSEELEQAIQLMISMQTFWMFQGNLQEGELWYTRVLEHKQLDTLPIASLAAIHYHLGRLLAVQGRLEAAIAQYEQSVALYDSIDDAIGKADVLNGLGVIEVRRGNLEQAEVFFNNVWELGQIHQEALADLSSRALTNLAVLAAQQHDWQRAEHLTREALMLYRLQNNELYVATALCNLSEIHLKRQQPTEALTYAHESIDILRRLNLLVRLVESLNNLGRAYMELEQYDQAYAAFHECMLLAHQTNNTSGLALTLEWIANWMDKQAHTEQAIQILGVANALRERSHTPRMITDNDEYELMLTAIKGHVDDDMWDEAWQKGQAMTPKQLIATLALPR